MKQIKDWLLYAAFIAGHVQYSLELRKILKGSRGLRRDSNGPRKRSSVTDAGQKKDVLTAIRAKCLHAQQNEVSTFAVNVKNIPAKI